MPLPSPDLLPAVLFRELRAASRRRSTYWIRVAVVMAGLGAMLLQFAAGRLASALSPWGRAPLPGAELFAALHTALCAGLLLAAPLFAADCIARERRDDTLGLLALTPLRPFQIVLGKAAAQVVRLLSLWIACLPLLLIPVLMGGVSVLDLQYALGIEMMIVLGGLASGLVATSFCRVWSRSAGLAFVLTLAGGQLLTLFAAVVLVTSDQIRGPGIPGVGIAGQSVWVISLVTWIGSTGLPGPGFGRLLGAYPSWVTTTTQHCLLAGIAICMALFGVSVLIAGWRVSLSLRSDLRSSSQRSIPTTRHPARNARGSSERRRQRWLAGNPARWLCEVSGNQRRGYWVWLLVVATTWIGLPWLARDDLEGMALTCFLPAALAIPLAMTAASSFRRELEEGTLELLLVTPLPARKLVWARVREQWSIYGPAALLHGVLSVVFALRWDISAVLLAFNWAGLSTIVTLPAVGIRFAVRRLHPLSGFFWSLLTLLILPLLIGLATVASANVEYNGSPQSAAIQNAAAFGTGFTTTQLGLSLVWGWLAARDLDTRWYLFRPFQRRAR